MKFNFRVLSILILLMLVSVSSEARKQRSDKGGHHHHSATYLAKKTLMSDEKTDTSELKVNGELSNIESHADANEEISDFEVVVFSMYFGLCVAFFLIGKWLSRRKYRNVLDTESSEHLRWLSETEKLEHDILLNTENEIENWKQEAKRNINLLLERGSLQNQDKEHFFNIIDDSNLGYAKDIYSRLINAADRREEWLKSYSKEDVENMISGNYWQGMSERQLVLMRGEPDKIESELLKTKVNKFYIYGSKSTGDVFVFNDGKLDRFKDR
jgi:hypothetical protein